LEREKWHLNLGKARMM